MYNSEEEYQDAMNGQAEAEADQQAQHEAEEAEKEKEIISNPINKDLRRRVWI